ncbi:hypothetical protein KC19_12G065200 [Ceratodon purpureus]|uniref:DUF7733 domain-containing protein n=1 Tax=Ceratodon purpureus TaxID=3225 RepID=A0A8T0GA24_CERPU|nr:hypothetical protein KC19_12G065200 [Ceratodon purpureus]
MGLLNTLVQTFFASVCISFVVQGWVPLDLLPFPLLTSIYIFILSKYIAPPVTSKVEPGLFGGSRLMKNYLLSAALIGIILPLVYIACAFLQGDLVAVKAAVPSLFLLIVQVLSENFTFRRASFSVLIRPLVPMLYNTRRLFTIWDELLFLFFGVGITKPGLLLFGRMLVVANAILWHWNLFGFLIPVYLVKSMRQHYDLENKVKE